jgi:hypothetical protein
MKRGLILSLIVLIVAMTSGIVSGQASNKESRDLKGFTRVNFGVSGDLYISFGKEFKIELEGSKSLLEDIVTEVSSGKLVIKKENWRMNMNEKVTVNITMPELDGIGVSGSGKAEVQDPIKATDLDLSVSGSGKIVAGEITVTNIKSSISGSGNIEIQRNGTAVDSEISISGSGNYSGDGLKMATAEISISGSGNCSCSVTDSIEAHISGSGNVTYSGNPKKVDARVSGSGKVRSR